MKKSIKPYNLGSFLVEECQRIRIQDFLKSYREKLKEMVLGCEIEARGFKVELTTSKTCFNGLRFWFKCPLCSRRVGVLFQHPLKDVVGCRHCLSLRYRKQRYKGMIEGDVI